MSDVNDKISELSPAKRALLERMRKQSAVENRIAPPIPRRKIRDSAPLSFAQQRLWVIHQLDPKSYLYNVPRAVRMRGRLDHVALERSLNEVVRRHEILRTSFVVRDGQPTQKIAPEIRIPIANVNLGDTPLELQHETILQSALELYRLPFDLSQGPLIRASLLKVGDDDHVLLLVMHHIISDGWTGGQLFQELGAMYQAFSRGEPSPIPDLSIQYGDYSAWQREWMQDSVLTKDITFWRERLKGSPAMIDLPTDNLRPEMSNYRGETKSVLLPKSLSDNLSAVGRQLGATLFTMLLTGLNILLSRWSGQNDLVVGTVTAGRDQTEIEKLLGCFVNFLPLREKLDPGMSGSELLQQVKSNVFDSFLHQDCPFEKIIEAINPERSLNVNPLYNVALLMQNYADFAFRSESIEAHFLSLNTEVSFLDLRFLASQNENGINLECEYNVELFERKTIEALLAGYQQVLEQLLAQPEVQLSEFRLPASLVAQASASASLRKKQTLAIAATFTAEPVEESLAFWMRELNIPADIVFAPYNQVFQQLLDPSSLISKNVDGVNILLIRFEDWGRGESSSTPMAQHAQIERSLHELIDALKSGGRRATPYIVGICPASRTASADFLYVKFHHRMEAWLDAELREISGAHLLTSDLLLRLYPVENYEDEYADKLGHIPYAPALFTALGSLLARRIYALRSAPHKVIVLDCDNTLWKGVCGEVGPRDVEIDSTYRMLQEFMIQQHDAGMLLCLCSKNVEEDVNAVFDVNKGMVLRREHLVASRVNWKPKSENLKDLARELQLGLDSFILVDDSPVECAEVRANCPEVLTLQLPEESSQIPEFLHHVWAFDRWKVTTEDTKRTALYRENRERDQLRKTAGSLDDFLASLQLKIDIREMQANDVSRVSQLTARTNQFNFTTIRRSESDIEQLSQDGFESRVVDLQDRFGNYGLVGLMIFKPSSKAISVDTFLLSCRALGRKVEHHMLAELGRLAQNNSASRVEITFNPTAKNKPALDFLESIGAQFKAADDVRAVYSLPADYAARATQIESSEAADLDAASAQSASSRSASRPILKTQVLDRIASSLRDVATISRAIESKRVLRARVQGAFVAPRTAVEELVADIWTNLLSLQKVGIHDNFFTLGGHSLLAAQVIARIRQVLNVELPLRAIFESPTVNSLARRIEFERSSEATPSVPPLIKSSRGENLQLSFAQQRLWFLDQLEPGTFLYNIPQMFRLQGTLNVEALRESINEVVKRHESLRTTFQTRDNEPVQIIAPTLDIPLPVTNLEHLREDTREAEASRLAVEESKRPFNLAEGPLLRASLWRLEPQSHILLLTVHHIVGDRWSMGILAKEVAANYKAFAEGHLAPLPELAVQYSDYAIWQRQWLGQGELLERQLKYWKRQLADAPELLDLPTDRPRPAVQTFRGASQVRVIPNALVEKLIALSRHEGATLFMTLLAAFELLLFRYSGQEDIVVGSPIANRNYSELEPLIGFFVNTLAFRLDISGDPSFRSLLARMKEVALGAYAHQDLPFERLVEEIQPERSLSHNPIFQVLFALQNIPLQTLDLPGVELQRLPIFTGTSMFDMSWFAIEVPEGLLLRAEYNTDLFDEETITRALGHFQNLLESIVADPELRISELPMLGGDERKQILSDFNDTARAYPKAEFCLPQLIEDQVESTPDATALVFEQHQLTYRELNARANQLAWHLKAIGVGPDVLVGVCAERSLEMVIALLGIMKAGGAYLPLDPDYPRERLESIVQDANPPVLLTQAGLMDRIPAPHSNVICLDRDWQVVAKENAGNLPVNVTGKNLAYAIYTSGSTGKPKGVPNVHEAIVNRLLWMQDEYRLTAADRVLQKTPYSFDVSVWEFFWPLITGASLVIARPGGHKDPSYLIDLIQKKQITTLHFVPSMLAMFLEAEGVERCKSLRRVFASGEALPFETQQRFFERLPAELHNLYGPTEAAVDVTYWECRRDSTRTTVPIGRPIANTQIYILDNNLQPLPIGIAGELHIGGIGLARGYLNRPELTAEKFIPDPYGTMPGMRLYKTGDLARFLPDGNIEYLGRLDNQVKLRGFRIELGEIETTLARHPSVLQTVVIVREDSPGLKQLVAYVVPNVSTPPTVDALRNHLKQTLPEFMVPAVFVFLDSIPLSSNGKINRKALPVPDSKPSDAAVFVAPRTPTEQTIADIWSRVLHRPQISVKDDFFSLGGHSLLATQVISRIRQAFQIDLPLRKIFEASTVASLSEQVEKAHRGFSIPEIVRVPRNELLPASFAQQRLCFLDQLEPNSPAYNIPWTLQVDGALNVEALQQSIDALVQRHETLRTTFSTNDGQPVQVINPLVVLPLHVDDLSNLPENEKLAKSRSLITEEANRPFNLSEGPLLRTTLIRLSAKDHILLINIHHIISDRWSLGVLSQELAEFYSAFSIGRSASLPELPVQYADFAVWQRKWLTGDVLDKQLSYWKTHLENAPSLLELPTDRPRPAVESFHGAVATTDLSRALTESLNKLSRDGGATLYITLLAAFSALLSRHSGQNDMVLGLPIANRNHGETEGLIGLFANTLPVRLQLDSNPEFLELVSHTKEVALNAYAHQDMPFEKLVEELRPERSLSHNPLVQIFFVLQNAPLETLNLAGLKLKPIESGTNTAKGDMFFSLAETPDGLRGRVEYNTDLFDAATIERMLEHYRVILEAVAANPRLRLSDLPLLTSSERQRILVGWNDTEFDYPRDLCLHEMFERQVERTPDAVAVSFPGETFEKDESQQLTYRELNQRANQLAHFLGKRGVGRGQRVGLLIERSLAMMVGLLGIQKSGAAYVPVDPSYPAERLRLIIEDAHVPLLLTQQSLIASIPDYQKEVVCLDSDWKTIAQQCTTNVESSATAEDVVYVIFTSGSTGRPKGVQVPHRAVVNLLSCMAEELHMTSADVFPALASFAFDMCIPELYLALVTGGRVVIARRELASNGEELSALLTRAGATIIHATPTTWNLLLEAGFSGKGLKRVIGAEPLPRDLCTRLLEADASLYNFYGPTETTVWSAMHHFQSKEEPVVVGHPLANTQIYILDKHLQPVPIGVFGEIHIGGDGMSYGYLNRPELTAERFIPNPFSDNVRAKLYKTGDLGRYLADGRIEFQGRVDNQVKIRGFRIELGEIEAVLEAHSTVKECVVSAREDVPGDKRLVAYVVPTTGETMNTATLRSWAKERLPEYMIPIAMVEMPRLPLTPNGKVDRKNLPAPDYARPELVGEYQQARNPVEEVIAGIWAQVLKLDQVGIEDDFFQLGGHSLLATQVVARIREAFQVELPLRALFEQPRVSGLASRVQLLQQQDKGLDAPPLKRVSRDHPLPLSFSQQRLWFLDQLEPDNPLYNVAHIVRIRGNLNADVLEKSLNEIVRRHEALRTSFQTIDDQPVQVIAPYLVVPLTRTDVTSLPESQREDEARRLATEEVRRPFHLSTGPLLRALLIKINDDDHAFILNTHHIISDRWSLGVFSQELARLYEAYLAERPSPLPELPIQYADYAGWQREYLSGTNLEKQLAYWRQQLDGAPPVLELPTDRPRQSVSNFWGAQHRQQLSPDLVKDLRMMSQRNSCTLFMSLLAAFQIMLSRASGQNDIVVGTDLANRTQIETEQLIGFFVNLLPIRARISSDSSFREVLTQVRETSLGAFAHQDVPFDKLIEELRPERSMTHNPLVQVLFVMQNTPNLVLEFGGLKLGALGVSSASRFDLVLFINDPEGAPYVTWMYNPNLFDGKSVASMAATYDRLLTIASADIEIKLKSIGEALNDLEKQQRGAQHEDFQKASLRKLRDSKRKLITKV